MYKIIIVDDELIVRHAVKTLIQWEGSRFEYAGSAANGLSAYEMALKTGADIVITDIKMPEMDGLELIKRLAADSFGGEVLVLSNYNDFDLVREALKLGAHDYMLKLTLKTDSFMETLEEVAVKLDGKRKQREEKGSKTGETKRDQQDLVKAMLLKLEAGSPPQAPDDDTLGMEAELFEAGGRVYSFAVLLQESAQGGDTERFQGTLDKLADSLFLGSRFTCSVRSGADRYLLIAVYASNAAVSPDDLAKRMNSLAYLYYNVKIQVVYSQPAGTLAELAEEMSRNRLASELMFYGWQRSKASLSNRFTTPDGEERFRLAEAKLRDSLRRPDADAIGEWKASALGLIDTASEHQINPRLLKRAVSAGIWSLVSMENAVALRLWDEKPWLEKVEKAQSDLQLKETVALLVQEALDYTGAFPAVKAEREEIRRALLFLEKNYPKRISTADVALHVGLSEPYACQLFKSETGVSILSYLNEIRMNKAHQLLASGKYLVKQAAAEVGIHDPFYFNRLFKKKYGYSPKNVKHSQD